MAVRIIQGPQAAALSNVPDFNGTVIGTSKQVPKEGNTKNGEEV
jgi:hypothetical protein